MPRIGVTGHTGLPPATAVIVFDALCAELSVFPSASVHGITCLAAGADQLFARAALAVGGTFEVIVPASDYRERVVSPDNQPEFDNLVRLATSVTCLPRARSSLSAYRAASRELLRRSDLLVAVWDESADRQTSETAAVVARARQMHMPVHVLWPANAVRAVGP